MDVLKEGEERKDTSVADHDQIMSTVQIINIRCEKYKYFKSEITHGPYKQHGSEASHRASRYVRQYNNNDECKACMRGRV